MARASRLYVCHKQAGLKRSELFQDAGLRGRLSI